jgi:hypothetical protein
MACILFQNSAEILSGPGYCMIKGDSIDSKRKTFPVEGAFILAETDWSSSKPVHVGCVQIWTAGEGGRRGGWRVVPRSREIYQISEICTRVCTLF